MISCTECKNSGYCPFWKSEKIDIRNYIEHEVPLNLCLQMVKLINLGEYLAENCKKLQKIT